MPLKPGLYEQLITQALQQELDQLDNRHQSTVASIDPGESHAVLSRHMALSLSRLLARVKGSGNEKRQKQIALCNELLVNAWQILDADEEDQDEIEPSGRRLLQIRNKAFADHPKPETPLSEASLLTATAGDPSLVSQLKQEILHADGVDILVSFIKWSGIRILKDELEEFTRRGYLRVITTSYLGATDLKAIKFLLSLPNSEVKVSFNTRQTRLHAKAYIFHRNSGFGACYIGSSNISRPAMSEGLEWNTKICQYGTAHLWEKINATFETYQCSREFEAITHADLTRLNKALELERHPGTVNESDHFAFFDITPYPYQQEILDKLVAERTLHGRSKNLVVAATGTGKTIIAAFDLKNAFPRPHQTRMLFIAHREEILAQSRTVFRHILKNENFGELWVGKNTPAHQEQLFVSVQTFRSQKLWESLSPDFYDYIVIDEFHHAAAPSYQELLDNFEPKILLGLTATPERTDGNDILKYFDYHISAEIRLPDAINRKLLSPFQYFGISDGVDYTHLSWRRGGYDLQELESLLITGDDMRARLIIDKTCDILLDVSQARGLCFCISQNHARYMAEKLNAAGIPAMALTSHTPDDGRKNAIRQLRNRELNFLCVVDLFNEGVDIPEIDTVLFLRPTESLTVFLQQLGRGLRLCEGKDYLTVLDFIGRAHQKFNFEIRFRALLGQTQKSVSQEIKASFPSLPSGCVIEMEKEAQKHVLENIRHQLRLANKNQLAARITSFHHDSGLVLTLENFIHYHHLSLDDIYRRASWSRLCVTAKMREDFEDPDEVILSKGLRRFCHNNSAPQLERLYRLLQDILIPQTLDAMPDADRKLLTMFCFSIWNSKPPATTISENLFRLTQNPVLLEEIRMVISLLIKQADIAVHQPEVPFICPLSIHACYTRDEILSGLGFLTFSHRHGIREGVKYLADIQTDLLFITLDKTEKDYSPTTMYQDYALDETLFHWQSQNATSDTSPTGQRYIHHQQQGSHILLFVREKKKIQGLACPYYFLGPATYVRHTGSKPMSIIWQLKHPMPARLIRTTRRLAVA